mgnify:CR=1 FL=1
MDPTLLKVVQLWGMVKASGKYPMDMVAPGVYFAATDEAPPQGVHGILDPISLCDFIHRRKTGRALEDSDRQALLALIEPSGGQFGYRAMRVMLVLPNLLLAAAIGAILAKMSWTVLAVAIFQRVWNGFARWLSASGHPSAGLHVGIALTATLASIVVTALSIFGMYSFP